uniref:Uncharacterized protein n=1 Tax=Florenciella sp. virus SA2 TaxID=3240092 RepID=A0AB39JEF8_9VIRU
MDSNQEKVLQEMIKEHNVQDNTSNIRTRRDSMKIRNDVIKIQNIKRRIKTNNPKKIKEEIDDKCPFLQTYYPSIYEKLILNEIHIKTLYLFLDELEKIENGTLNQHEASYNIGMLLKSMYIDKKIKKPKSPTYKSIDYKTYLEYSQKE